MSIVVKKFGVRISKTTIYNVLHSAKITRKKIQHKLVLTDQVKRNEQIEHFKEQLKDVPIRNIISIDETSVDSHIHPNIGWSKSGKRIGKITKHKRVRYTVTCAICFNKILHTKTVKGSSNAIVFTEFMKNMLIKLPPNEKYYVILDNVRIHHSKIFKAYIKDIDNIELIYNVPYSPESNPIELFFSEYKRYLKNEKIDNRNIVSKIKKALLLIKTDNLEQYFTKSLNYYI